MNPFRITSLEAHQIGPFGELKMTFPEKPAGMEDKSEVHVLTGENGTGKSTIMEMLASHFANKLLDGQKAKFRKEWGQFDIKFSPDPSPFTWMFQEGVFHKNAPPTSWIKDYVDNLDNPKHPLRFAVFCYSSYRHVEHTSIHSIQEIVEHPLSNSTDFINSISPSHILQWIANNIAKEAIAKNQNDAFSAVHFQKSIKQLEGVIASIIEKPVRFIFEYNPIGILIEVNHERLDFNLLPDGLKSIISWLADLLMRMDRVKWVDDTPVLERNFILFLDEIEVHIHPRWQRKILPAVQGLFPNAQIFISTHSPFVINSVDGAWIHRLVKPNGDSVALEPILSEDGKSITQVLEEIFDVTERFGVGVEIDLKAFYEVRNKLIKNGSSIGKDKEDLIQIAKKLQGQSTTLDQIVAMEIRQLNRIKQLEIIV